MLIKKNFFLRYLLNVKIKKEKKFKQKLSRGEVYIDSSNFKKSIIALDTSMAQIKRTTNKKKDFYHLNNNKKTYHIPPSITPINIFFPDSHIIKRRIKQKKITN